MTKTSPRQLLDQSEVLFSETDVAAAIQQLATEVSSVLTDSEPLVLCVMSGATVFAGQLLPLLRFPLEFDYVQASRYHNRTTGSDDVVWKMSPGENVRGRTLLLLDDILDEGPNSSAHELPAGCATIHKHPWRSRKHNGAVP